MDEIALAYRDKLFPIISPLINTLLGSKSWVLKYFLQFRKNEKRESGIYALGVISIGCENAIKPYLPSLIQVLFNFLNDTEPFIRHISCWTLSRFAHSFFELDPTGEQHLFLEYLKHLMQKVRDPDAFVQEGACGSAIELMESVPEKLIPYAFDILQVFVDMLKSYKKGPALAGLYDAISKLVSQVYQEKIQNDVKALELLVPALFEQWDSIKDTDRLLCPLMEVFQAVINMIGPMCEKFAPTVLKRCISVMSNLLPLLEDDIKHAAERTPIVDKEFLIRSIDTIGALCCALKEKIEHMLSAHGELPAKIFISACYSSDSQVRQYACAMIGDVVKAARNYLKPFLGEIIPLLLSYLKCDTKEMTTELSIANNSCWTISEVILAYPELSVQIVPQCIEPVAKLLNTDRLARSLAQNAAIIIGRMGIYAPREVSPFLEGILRQWCLTMRALSDMPEKQQAFRGICNVILVNALGALKYFPYFCDAVIEYKNPGEDLEKLFKGILTSFKESIGEKWAGYVSAFPADLRQKLNQRFGI